MNNELIIEVGLPDPCLNPNRSKSTHWAKRGASAKTLRNAVVNTVRMMHPEYVGAGWEKAAIKYDFFHKSNRVRDDDNFRAMMKSARDAFGPEIITKKHNVYAGAGVVVDDTYIKDNQPVGFHIDKENPRVRITLTRSCDNGITHTP